MKSERFSNYRFELSRAQLHSSNKWVPYVEIAYITTNTKAKRRAQFIEITQAIAAEMICSIDIHESGSYTAITVANASIHFDCIIETIVMGWGAYEIRVWDFGIGGRNGRRVFPSEFLGLSPT